MSKYIIKLQPNNLSKPEKKCEVIGLDLEHAKETCLIFNKKCHIVSGVRVGQNTEATRKVLNDLIGEMWEDINSLNEELYNRHSYVFEETVKGLKNKMNIVSWNKTKEDIPKKPKFNNLY